MRERDSVIHYKSYVRIWLTLIFLTGLSVASAGMDLGRWTVIFVLTVAAIKSGLILNYFMHLKYEKIRLIQLMILGTLVLLILFIGLTFLDVVFR